MYNRVLRRRILKTLKQLLRQNNSVTPSSFAFHTTDLERIC